MAPQSNFPIPNLNPGANEPEGSNPASRLERLEEAQLYAERANEELNSALIDLARRLEETMARLNRLEGRLTNLLTNESDLGNADHNERDDDPTDRNHTES